MWRLDTLTGKATPTWLQEAGREEDPSEHRVTELWSALGGTGRVFNFQGIPLGSEVLRHVAVFECLGLLIKGTKGFSSSSLKLHGNVCPFGLMGNYKKM